jgi:hypothetical protein
MMFTSFSSTGIGSLPHTDPAEACRIILDSVDIPFWPQLPHRSFLELMVPQYSEGFPFVRIEGEHIYVEEAAEEEKARFYEAIAAGKGFAISREFAAGLYAFLDTVDALERRPATLKGHVTGPLTFTLSLTDSRKRPIFFDDELRELALELLKGKVIWQVEILRRYADEVIIFIDEPILSALGTSAYIAVDMSEAQRALQEIVRSIRDTGALAAIHCCSKADWPLVLSTGLDILSFDSYFYWDSLGSYPEEVKSFIDRKGVIAWGVVPTTDIIREVTLEGLSEQLERGLSSLEKTGIAGEKLRNQVLLSPSCGTGSMEPEDALRVFSLLKELRNRYVRG